MRQRANLSDMFAIKEFHRFEQDVGSLRRSLLESERTFHLGRDEHFNYFYRRGDSEWVLALGMEHILCEQICEMNSED